jgi:hypothetical protein
MQGKPWLPVLCRIFGAHGQGRDSLSLASEPMNRSLALYLLLLNFFLLLIAGAEVYLLRHQAILWRPDFFFALSALFVCPVCSTIYIFHSAKSQPVPDREDRETVIDEMLSRESTDGTPIPNGIKACGIVAAVLAVTIFGELTYGLFKLYELDLLLSQFRTNPSLSVVLVVLLFNALCQPWYVWRTFLNVNLKNNKRL